MALSSFTHTVPALLFVAVCHANTYNEDETFNTLSYAYGAYCDAADLRAWDCSWCTSNFDITSHGAGVIDTGDLQAFMGYDQDESRIVLSFRGSANVENWLNNLGQYSILLIFIHSKTDQLHVFYFQFLHRNDDDFLSTS